MTKSSSLKKCNDSICIKHCTACLDINYGNYDYFINVEKLIIYMKSKLYDGDLIDKNSIYSKSYMENSNMFDLLTREFECEDSN